MTVARAGGGGGKDESLVLHAAVAAMLCTWVRSTAWIASAQTFPSRMIGTKSVEEVLSIFEISRREGKRSFGFLENKNEKRGN